MLRNGRRSLPDRLLARRAARNAAVAGTPPFAGVAFAVIALCGVLAATTARADDKDIEYVAEHLPEVAMDNRYAALPVWRSSTAGRGDADSTRAFKQLNIKELCWPRRPSV